LRIHYTVLPYSGIGGSIFRGALEDEQLAKEAEWNPGQPALQI